MFLRAKIAILLFIVVLGGCAKYQGVMTLKNYAAGQRQIQDYVRAQEELFLKLKQDFNDNKLEKGMPQSEITSIYGEPILSRSIDNKEVFLYRHPTEYFDTDRIYLYFDKNQVTSPHHHLDFGG